jgi:uncharacterized repeat protein (TIGR01451 family)
LKGDGTVWAWGANAFGQLSEGTTTSRTAPVQVSGLRGVAAIAAGSSHSLALKDDGTVWAWGWNGYGLLGDGTTTDRSAPVQVSGLTDVAVIAAGGDHNLALKRDGTVWFWGVKEHGALAYGQTTQRILSPVEVTGLSGTVAIAAGFRYSLAVKSDGTVWAWYGLGDGTAASQTPPVQVSGLSGVVAIAAGFDASMALKDDRTVWEWVVPEVGTHSPPAEVGGLGGVVAIAEGSNGGFMCENCAQRLALKSDGTVWAWGGNDSGQLGDGTTTDRSTPVQVGGLTRVVAVAAGASHSLAVKSDGTVWAWGSNNIGQLGEGRSATRTTPVQVIPPGSPDLAIAMSHSGDFTVGSQGVYTVAITNIGAPATSGVITVIDMLPPGLTYISATGSGWNCSVSDETVTCTNPEPVNPGVSSTITLTVNVGAAASPGATNFAMVSNPSDLSTWNNTAGDPAVVVQR